MYIISVCVCVCVCVYLNIYMRMYVHANQLVHMPLPVYLQSITTPRTHHTHSCHLSGAICRRRGLFNARLHQDPLAGRKQPLHRF